MWVTSHSAGECPLFCTGDMPSPPATDCGQLFLSGDTFPQPEEGPCGKREPPQHTAALLNLAQPQLFGVMGEDLLPPECHFPKLKCWGRECLNHTWGSAALRPSCQLSGGGRGWVLML